MTQYRSRKDGIYPRTAHQFRSSASPIPLRVRRRCQSGLECVVVIVPGRKRQSDPTLTLCIPCD
jgi:hypothetical protein